MRSSDDGVPHSFSSETSCQCRYAGSQKRNGEIRGMVTKHWLVVVRPDCYGATVAAQRRLARIAHVVVDRRRRERRRAGLRVEADRRREERRQPVPSQERDRWERFGYQILYQPDGVQLGDDPRT